MEFSLLHYFVTWWKHFSFRNIRNTVMKLLKFDHRDKEIRSSAKLNGLKTNVVIGRFAT